MLKPQEKNSNWVEEKKSLNLTLQKQIIGSSEA